MTRYVLIIVALILTTLYALGQCSVTFNTTNGILCYGDCNASISANPVGSPPFIYIWSTGDTTQTITNLCAGVYTLTSTDSSGCVAIDSLIISEPPQLIATTTVLSNPSVPAACDAELTYSVTGGTIPYTAQWYDCANDTIFSWPLMPPPPWYFCAGEWGIIIVDGNGCSDTSCVTVTDPPTAIHGFNDQQEGLSYQLLGRSIIFSIPIKNIRIMDALGHLILYSTDQLVYQVDLQNVPAGLYILSAKTTQGQQLMDKLIIRKE